jgi:coenzyme Q-binding protein COQ10
LSGVTVELPRHSERRRLPFSAPQLFDLVADVERYPDFLPAVAATEVRRREGNMVWLDMVVGAGPLRRRFASKAVLDRPRRIEITSADALFERYRQRWTFEPDAEGGTTVECDVDVALRSRLLRLIMGATLEPAAKAMVAAFERRARRIYGRDKKAAAKR